MRDTQLRQLLIPSQVSERKGIFISNTLTNQTVWDALAEQNPTNAVISAKDEATAAEKSADQIADIKSYLNESDILLDLGSGYGRVAKYLLPQMELAGYIGVDSSHIMLELFQERYDRSAAEQGTPVMFVGSDIHSLPLQDNSIDVAIACAVFLHNHKEVIERSIKEQQRVLKPGGKLLVYSSFPRLATLLGLQGMLYQAFLNLMGRPYKNGPVRYYSRREVLRLLSAFEEVEIHPYGFTLIPKTLIFLPAPLEKLYRALFAEPINKLVEKIIPLSLKPYFATHYDVVATL